jgi:hypothetical protein
MDAQRRVKTRMYVTILGADTSKLLLTSSKSYASGRLSKEILTGIRTPINLQKLNFAVLLTLGDPSVSRSNQVSGAAFFIHWRLEPPSEPQNMTNRVINASLPDELADIVTRAEETLDIPGSTLIRCLIIAVGDKLERDGQLSFPLRLEGDFSPTPTEPEPERTRIELNGVLFSA